MEKRVKNGLIRQIYILILVCVCLSGAVTYFSQKQLSEEERREGIRQYAEQVTGEVVEALQEYPAWPWLLRYWYENADTLDIEYDKSFHDGKVTEEKFALLSEHQPELLLPYAASAQIEALPEEDQKLYAEITYSWMITRMNRIKRNYGVDFLYCVVTETAPDKHPYESQFFLLSAANPDEKRGTGRYEVYPIGVVSQVADNKSLQAAMREAVESAGRGEEGGGRASDPDESGSYIDDYTLLGWIGDRAVLAGISLSVSEVLAQMESETREGTLYAMLYQFLLLNIIMLVAFLYGIRPLKKILLNIRSYTEKKDSTAVRESLSKTLTGPGSLAVRHNEIGQMAEDFMDLTGEIDDYVGRIREITAEKERIDAELNLASGIQSHMVPASRPDYPGRTDFDLYASMDPAKEVGGDFYDYFLVDEKHLALVMADVSGKGVPAALFMVIAKTLIKNRIQMGESPGEVLFHVNNQLCEGNEEQFFVTVWLAVIDLTTGKGIAANVGHEHPVLCRKGETYELVRYKHSPVIAMMEDLRFAEHEFTMSPGDRLFVYTDGVPEANDPDGQLFGTDRMLEALNDDPEAPPEDLLRHITQKLEDFENGGGQFDDITMMCFWYREQFRRS